MKAIIHLYTYSCFLKMPKLSKGNYMFLLSYKHLSILKITFCPFFYSIKGIASRTMPIFVALVHLPTLQNDANETIILIEIVYRDI